MDIVYRYAAAPSEQGTRAVATADDAIERLEAGNRRFARPDGEHIIYADPRDLGLPLSCGAPKQAPFAVVLGCSDARAPTEQIFSCSSNELFVVRVAGNVLGDECLGSIDYAVRHLRESVRLMVVLGHSKCGAVTAAVDSYLSPRDYADIACTRSLRSIVNGIMVAVRGSAKALERSWGHDVHKMPGYRDAMLELAVCLNAALSAHHLRREMASATDTPIEAAYGVFDLASRHVRLPIVTLDHAREDDVYLAKAPSRPDDFVLLASMLAESECVRELLHGAKTDANG